MKRILWWGLAACVIVPGVVLGGMAAVNHARAYAIYRGFAGLSPEQRAERLLEIGYERDWRLAGLVDQTLASPPNRGELQAAGYAAMRLERLEYLPLLQKHAQAGPDDYTRAMLVVYAARLSDRDTRLTEWLGRGLASDQPWYRAGSAAGLMHLGRTQAGPALIHIARGDDPEQAAFAMRELAWISAPMAEAIGRPMELPEPQAMLNEPRHLEHIEQFWSEHVSVDLLNDVLGRLTRRDREWTEMGRLIHARNKVAKLMQ